MSGVEVTFSTAFHEPSFQNIITDQFLRTLKVIFTFPVDN